MQATYYPFLYQINTRVWLRELSVELNRPATLDDIPDSELDRFVQKGMDWIWLLSVWQTGSEGQLLSRTDPTWLKEFNETLDDLTDLDIEGSGFAISSYVVHKILGGDDALARLRKRMQDRGLKLMLDFVPNHTALDHEWVQLHPEYYICGDAQLLSSQPKNYKTIKTISGELILAHGRDPFFPGWPDTLQLNYNKVEFQEALLKELIKVAGQCDGVRCDMAMLIIPDVFEKTWGLQCNSFWPNAMKAVKEHTPGFVFMAEVYWGLEWTLQEMGFDFTYDKRLYDRLKEGDARSVHDHLLADIGYQNKMARFLENHDEPRAAAAFPEEKNQAAAIISYFSTGLRFFHQGQFEGKKKRISPHLVRGPIEPVNQNLKVFYDKLLMILHQPVFKKGRWKLVDPIPAWNENWSYNNYICYAWELEEENKKAFVAVNYSPGRSQCYTRFPFRDLLNKTYLLRDLFSPVVYERDGNDLQSGGLYLDEPGWKYYVFEVVEK